MSSSEEKEILKRAILADKASLEWLVMRYKDMAYTIAFKVLNNNEDAEEVVQDAFMKAFSGLANFRELSRFSTWLYRIVYNTAITKTKSKKVITGIEEEHYEESEIIDTANCSWTNLMAREQKELIHMALLQLSVEDRTLITLYHIAEISIAEICEITGLRKSAVKMRLLRARKQLKAHLEESLTNEIKDLL